MSILWIRETVDSGGGSSDLNAGKAGKKYFKTFQILTDDYGDGPQTISSHPDFPQPYEVYRAGTDYDEDALLTKIPTFVRDKEQPKLWRCKCVYTVLPGRSATTPDTMDVTNFLPGVRSWKIPYEEIVWMARRQLVGTDWTSPDESYATAIASARRLVANSVNEMFDSGIATLKHALAVEISRYEWYYSLTRANAYEDTVNADTFWDFTAGKVKMVAIQGNLTNVQNSLVHRVTYEFHIRDDGWVEPIPDHGWHKHTTTGSGPSGVAVITDDEGQPHSAPSLLDGAGYSALGVSQPLAIGATPYLVKWHHLDESTFATLALPTRTSLNIT